VKFGGIAAASFTVNSATSITATSPAMAGGTVDIIVTTPGGTSASSVADQFTYVLPPGPTPKPGFVSPASGGSDSDYSGQQPGTHTFTSPGAGAGQSMTFVTGDFVSEDRPYVIIAVTVVPKGNRDQTELTLTSAYTTPASLPGNRHTAGLVSIVLVGVNPASIDQGTITFAVLKSWLEKYNLEPKDIVLMHNTNGIWSELPTTYDRESGGAFFFTATTPSFSYFAITTRTTGTSVAEISPPAITTVSSTSIRPVNENVMTQGPTASTAQSDLAIVTQTSVPYVSLKQQDTGSFPLFMILGGIAGIVIIMAGGLYIRRWWIRRQNPVLFRDDE